MSKHTPGPWIARPSSTGIVYISDSRSRTIAQAWDFPEAAANGRVIAAAPLMLAALKEAYREDHGGYSGEQVKAAILAADPDAFDAEGDLK